MVRGCAVILAPFSHTIRRVERSSDPRAIDPAELALRDDLTGAWNRRYLRRFLDEEWTELAATQGTITLLVLDLDFFKEINDTYGHLVGDDVLLRAANQLRSSFRAEDRLIRHGGDEFVVALCGVGGAEARALGERARTALRTVEVETVEDGEAIALPLSFSMGVASFPVDGATGTEILAVADRRLYEEKRARLAAARTGDRGRWRILTVAALALVALAGSAWIEWRHLRRAPPPPPAPAALSLPVGADAPPAEIVVRDEQELLRLRAEVQRLLIALAEPHQAEDQARYEARIRELEARLSEAGDEHAAPPEASAAAGSDTAGEGGIGIADSGVGDATAGMRIGERRTREGLDLAPAPSVGGDGSSPAAGAGEAATTASRAVEATAGEPGVERPVLLRAERPAYPRIARERRKTATVELKVRVDAAGQVLEAEPVGPPAGFGFDESARQAAMSARFRPGRRDGVAVEMETRLAIRFLLEGPPR